MLEDVGEFDKGGFGVGSSHLHDPATEGFAKGMGGEMPDFKPVAAFQFLEYYIEPLDRVYGLFAANKRLSGRVRKVQCLETFLCVVPEVLIYADGPAFLRFLFNDFKLPGEQVAIPQRKDVADAKPRKASRSDEERDGVVG